MATITKECLEMIDKGMENFKKGIVSEPIDMDELDELLRQMDVIHDDIEEY